MHTIGRPANQSPLVEAIVWTIYKPSSQINQEEPETIPLPELSRTVNSNSPTQHQHSTNAQAEATLVQLEPFTQPSSSELPLGHLVGSSRSQFPYHGESVQLSRDLTGTSLTQKELQIGTNIPASPNGLIFSNHEGISLVPNNQQRSEQQAG